MVPPPSGGFGYVPLVVNLTTLAAVAGVSIVKIPFTCTVFAISGSLRLLTSGTHTVLVKNGASTLGTLTWSAAGLLLVCKPPQSPILM